MLGLVERRQPGILPLFPQDRFPRQDESTALRTRYCSCDRNPLLSVQMSRARVLPVDGRPHHLARVDARNRVLLTGFADEGVVLTDLDRWKRVPLPPVATEDERRP